MNRTKLCLIAEFKTPDICWAVREDFYCAATNCAAAKKLRAARARLKNRLDAR